jgi:hypothetical protein
VAVRMKDHEKAYYAFFNLISHKTIGALFFKKCLTSHRDVLSLTFVGALYIWGIQRNGCKNSQGVF